MPLSIDFIADHPKLLSSLADFSGQMKRVHDSHQRLAANFGFHRRWLISQAAMACHWDPHHGLTVPKLVEKLKPYKIASPNTVRDFIDEQVAYGFIVPDPEYGSKRPRYWAASAVTIAVFTQWLVANLTILDGFDGSDRASRLLNAPDRITTIQPLFALSCLDDARWREPPETVSMLLNTVAGGLIMDQIVLNVEDRVCENGHWVASAIDSYDLARQVNISRTHLQRMLNKVAEAGLLGSKGRSCNSQMWVSRNFLDDYCHWQAVKLHHLDRAFLLAFPKVPADCVP